MEFVESVKDPKNDTYLYYGYSFDEIQVGQYYARDMKLYQKMAEGEDLLISENPEFKFDFSKYMERFQLKKPQIISILMGANDLQLCPYEQSKGRIDRIYISPTLACIDPDNGFPYAYEKLNKYTEETAKSQSNWVHPNDSGYRQMGDALASVIEYIRMSI